VRVVLAGGSGFLGGALASALKAQRHSIAILTRHPTPGTQDQIAWVPDGTAGTWAKHLDGAEAIVNLAGEGIADRRWTAARKRALRDSRILPTRSLVVAMRQLSAPPSVFVSQSGINYYGPRGSELTTESTPAGSDFLAGVCVEWEQEAEQASSMTRVVVLRTSPVLNNSGGVMGKMLLPFRLGLGGRFGDGSQYMPWIHMTDWLDLVISLLATERARGAFNATAPGPVTNREFARTLGKVLGRPALIPVPAFALRVMVGELAEILLTGQRALPTRAEEVGFRFKFPQLEGALRDLLN
jgi:uncharacterized protein (TIGR01777 family)